MHKILVKDPSLVRIIDFVCMLYEYMCLYVCIYVCMLCECEVCCVSMSVYDLCVMCIYDVYMCMHVIT